MLSATTAYCSMVLILALVTSKGKTHLMLLEGMARPGLLAKLVSPSSIVYT